MFDVDPETGIIHCEMNTPGVQMAYAVRRFLQMVHETGNIGRVAYKPTQAQEDGVNSGILSWMLQGTKFQVGRRYAVDGYVEHRELVDRIVNLPTRRLQGRHGYLGRAHRAAHCRYQLRDSALGT